MTHESDPLLDALAEVVGERHVLTDREVVAAHTTDWTGRWSGPARAVVRPGSAAEVAAVLAACARSGVAVVPQGGNTGLVGGGVPRAGEVVVVTTRLDALDPVDVDARQVRVGAGATLAAVRDHAAAAGLGYGVDLAARDTATIGGTIATDAGGTQVVRYGTTRAQVRALEVVRADGCIEVVDDADGLDALVGSEGTLAIVTAAVLRLHEPPRTRAVALLALDDVSTAVAAQERVRTELGTLEASELLLGPGLARVLTATGARPPFPDLPPVAWLVEVADDAADRLLDVLAALSAAVPGIRDAVLATEAGDRARLWQLREAHTEALARAGPVVKLDVVLPPAAVPSLLEVLPEVVGAAGTAAGSVVTAGTHTPAASSIEVVVFGHLAIADLHVNLLGVPPAATARVEEAVWTEVVARGGSPFGEHGIGVHKRHWVERTLGAARLAALQAERREADPHGLLNPGVRLPEG